MVVQAVLPLIAPFLLSGYAVLQCGKKKATRKPLPPSGDGMFLSARKDSPLADGAHPKAPENQGAMADPKDPAYETLVGLGNDCFDKKKKEEGAARKPETTPKQDPNYQNLTAIEEQIEKKEGEKKKEPEEKEEEKKEAKKEGSKEGSKEGDKKDPEKKEDATKAPTAAKPVAAEPNYQNLADIGNEVDKDKKKK